MAILELENTATTPESTEWRDVQAGYRCHICLVREEEGGFSAIVVNLPGAASCGDTEEEALENVREAAAGVIESYLEAGEDIPWTDSASEEVPPGAQCKWILVNA